MAIQTPEELLFRSAAVSQQEQNIGNNKAVDSATAHCRRPHRFPSNGGVRSVWTISTCVRMRYVRLLEGSPSSLETEELS